MIGEGSYKGISSRLFEHHLVIGASTKGNGKSAVQAMSCKQNDIFGNHKPKKNKGHSARDRPFFMHRETNAALCAVTASAARGFPPMTPMLCVNRNINNLTFMHLFRIQPIIENDLLRIERISRRDRFQRFFLLHDAHSHLFEPPFLVFRRQE